MMNDYLKNVWRDLDKAEQQQRIALEEKVKESVKLLIDLANALRHEAMEESRRMDPYAPFNWTYLDWRRFWFEKQQIVSDETAQKWEGITLEDAGKNPELLGMPKFNTLDVFRAWKYVIRMQEKLNEPREEIAALRAQLKIREEEIVTLKIKLRRAETLLQEKMNTHPALQCIKNKKESNSVPVSMFEKELVLWNTIAASDQLPDHWKTQYNCNQSATRIMKAFGILFAVYSAGISCWYEVEWLVQLFSNVSRNNRSIQRGLQDLKKEGLVFEYFFELKEFEVDTRIRYLGLKEKGRQLCKDWDLPPAERLSQFEQALVGGANPKSPVHQLMFAVSFHAHMRNWEYRYFPDNGADLMVSKNGQVYAVVVVPEKSEDDEIIQKMQQLQANGEKLAFVTISGKRGARLAAQCKKQAIPCVYTDMKFLIDCDPDTKKIVPFTFEDYAKSLPLWVESRE